MMSQIQTHGIDRLAFSNKDFVEFCTLNQNNQLSDHHAKMIIEHMISTGKSAPTLITEL